jgi:hypothetical protein
MVATTHRATSHVGTTGSGAPTERDDTLMARLAVVRLRRFGRIAAVAEASDSRLWQLLARRAAESALRDCLLLSLPDLGRRSPRAEALARGS